MTILFKIFNNTLLFQKKKINWTLIYFTLILVWYSCLDFILFNQYCLTNNLTGLLIILYTQLFCFFIIYLYLFLSKKKFIVFIIVIIFLACFFNFKNLVFNIIPFFGFFRKDFSYNLSLVGIVILTGDLLDSGIYTANLSIVLRNITHIFSFQNLWENPFQAFYNNLGFIEKPPRQKESYDLALIFANLLDSNRPKKLLSNDQVLKNFPELCLYNIKNNEYTVLKKPFNNIPLQDDNFSICGYNPDILKKRTLFIYEEIGVNGGRTENFFVKTFFENKPSLVRIKL